MKGYGSLIQMPTEPVAPQALEQFEKIVHDHPTCIYSHYLALALGKHFLSKFKLGFVSANKYLENASNMKQAPELREEAMALRTELLIRDLGQKEKGTQVAEQALKEFPNSRYKGQFEEWLKRARSTKTDEEQVEERLQRVQQQTPSSSP